MCDTVLGHVQDCFHDVQNASRIFGRSTVKITVAIVLTLTLALLSGCKLSAKTSEEACLQQKGKLLASASDRSPDFARGK